MSIERGKRYTEDQKQELLELFCQSGMSVSRFCKKMNLSYLTLKRWLGPNPVRPVQFVELDETEPSEGRLSVPCPTGCGPSSRSAVTDPSSPAGYGS